MSEATEPAVMEGQAEEAPQSTEPEFGFDDTEDNLGEAPEAPSGEPEVETQSTTDPADDGGALRQADYTRKTQDLANERKAFQEERQAWQREMQSQREQLQTTLQAVQQPQAAQQGLADRLRQVASDPNLTPQDRAGLDVIAGMASELEEAKRTIAEFGQFREQFSSQFEQTSQMVQGLTQAQQSAQANMLGDQLAEANELFGKEVVDANMAVVRRMGTANGKWSPETNPRTGKPFTIAELVGMGSGRIAEDSQNARNAQRNGSRGAKKFVAGTGVTTPTTSGAASKAEIIAEIASNQRAYGHAT